MPKLVEKVVPVHGYVKPSPTEVFWGVDPGKDGGIVRLGPSLQESWAWPMPSSVQDLRSILVPVPNAINFICLEDVWSSPQMGVVSAFTFGRGFGRLEGLAFRFSRIVYTRPRVWQKALGIPRRKPNTKTKQVRHQRGKNKGKLHKVKWGGESDKQWKNRLKEQAELLFPQVPITLKTADAFLIAEYCRRTMGEKR